MNVKDVLSLEPKAPVSSLRGEVVDLRPPEAYGSRGDKKAWGLIKDAAGDKMAFVHWKCPDTLPYGKGDFIEITAVQKDGRPQGATYDPHNGKDKVSAWPGSIKKIQSTQPAASGRSDPGWVAGGAAGPGPAPASVRAVPAREALTCLGRLFDHLLAGPLAGIENGYARSELAFRGAVDLTLHGFLTGRLGMPEAVAAEEGDDEPPPFSVLLPFLTSGLALLSMAVCA